VKEAAGCCLVKDGLSQAKRKGTKGKGAYVSGCARLELLSASAMDIFFFFFPFFFCCDFELVLRFSFPPSLDGIAADFVLLLWGVLVFFLLLLHFVDCGVCWFETRESARPSFRRSFRAFSRSKGIFLVEKLVQQKLPAFRQKPCGRRIEICLLLDMLQSSCFLRVPFSFVKTLGKDQTKLNPFENPAQPFARFRALPFCWKKEKEQRRFGVSLSIFRVAKRFFRWQQFAW
jgi:hypothetical protein